MSQILFFIHLDQIKFSIIYRSAILFFILCIKIMETHRHSDEANEDDL